MPVCAGGGGKQAISLSYQLIHMLPCDESTPCVVCHQLDHKDWSFNQTIKDDHVASSKLCVYLAEIDSSHHLLLLTFCVQFTVTVLMHACA